MNEIDGTFFEVDPQIAQHEDPQHGRGVVG
jgi:hypothetical protein